MTSIPWYIYKYIYKIGCIYIKLDEIEDNKKKIEAMTSWHLCSDRTDSSSKDTSSKDTSSKDKQLKLWRHDIYVLTALRKFRIFLVIALLQW